MKLGLVLKILGALVALLFVLLIGGYFWTRSYIRSEEFQKIVTHEIEKVVGGEVTVSGTEWDGWKLECDALAVMAATKFSDLEVNRISVELDPRGLFDGVWRVANVHIREVSMVVSAERLKQQPSYVAKPAPVEFGVKDVGKAWLPRKAEVNAVTVENAHGTFSLEGLSGIWRHVALELEREGEDYLVTGLRGDISVDKYPGQVWDISVLKGRLKPDSFFLNDLVLKSDGAVISARGEYEKESGLQVSGELKDYPVERVLSADWKTRLTGRAMGTFSAEQSYGRRIANGNVEVERAVITALPFLDAMADFTKLQKFRLIPLDACQADFEVVNDQAQLTNILLESNDFIKVTGSYTQSDVRSRGELEVGISDRIMPAMPIGTKEVFSRKEGGYHWTTMKISHTEEGWQEDLSSRYFSAAIKAGITDATQKAADAVESVNDAASSVLQGEGSVLESGQELLNKGAQSLFDLLGN